MSPMFPASCWGLDGQLEVSLLVQNCPVVFPSKISCRDLDITTVKYSKPLVGWLVGWLFISIHFPREHKHKGRLSVGDRALESSYLVIRKGSTIEYGSEYGLLIIMIAIIAAIYTVLKG